MSTAENPLNRQACEACRKDAPTVAGDELQTLLAAVPQWIQLEIDGEQHIERLFRFRDFAGALAFTVKVGELAESEQHHPALLTEWGKVKVTWWTHKIGGLHRNDFIMAAKTDELYEGG